MDQKRMNNLYQNARKKLIASRGESGDDELWTFMHEMRNKGRQNLYDMMHEKLQNLNLEISRLPPPAKASSPKASPSPVKRSPNRIPESLRANAKKYKVTLTKRVNGRRIYKTTNELRNDIKKKTAKKKSASPKASAKSPKLSQKEMNELSGYINAIQIAASRDNNLENLKKQAKKLKIRVTNNVNGKRVPKSANKLRTQISNALSKKARK